MLIFFQDFDGIPFLDPLNSKSQIESRIYKSFFSREKKEDLFNAAWSCSPIRF